MTKDNEGHHGSDDGGLNRSPNLQLVAHWQEFIVEKLFYVAG